MSGYLGRVLSGGVAVGSCFQVAPRVLVTAFHVLEQVGLGEVGAVVMVDGLTREVPAVAARVVRVDRSYDLAVVVCDTPLPGCVEGFVASGGVAGLTEVVVTGVARVDDPGRVYRYLDAPGWWCQPVFVAAVDVADDEVEAAAAGLEGEDGGAGGGQGHPSAGEEESEHEVDGGGRHAREAGADGAGGGLLVDDGEAGAGVGAGHAVVLVEEEVPQVVRAQFRRRCGGWPSGQRGSRSAGCG